MRFEKGIRGILLIFCSLLTSGVLLAQDPAFSQTYSSPMHLNPALTGVFNGQFRAHANYRSQWNSILGDVPYKTFAISGDYRYNLAKSDYVAVGLSAMADKAGTSNFNQYRVHASISYLKQIAGGRYTTSDQYIVVGAQLGTGKMQFDLAELWFSSQFDASSETVNTGLASGEAFGEETDQFMDFNVGLLWYAVFRDNLSIYAGGAFYHLNEPNIGFGSNPEVKLARKWVAHIGGELGFGGGLSLLPVLAVQNQEPHLQILGGAQLRYTHHDWNEIALRVGVFGRVTKKFDGENHLDAIIAMGFLELENVGIGFSYDINTSHLNQASNYRGAFEVSLKYIHAEKRRVLVSCPTF